MPWILKNRAKNRSGTTDVPRPVYNQGHDNLRGIGFCVTVGHARFMAERFNKRGIASAVLVGETETEDRSLLLENFRNGQIKFLFTRDVLNEGLDIPDINTVLFLRPTESLTVFLQQLGRGLRHSPGKDCLTVIDFVGQAHRRYKIFTKLKALFSKRRYNILKEVEEEFPHLPPGCSIILDRIAQKYVLENIRQNLSNLRDLIPEQLTSFTTDSGLPIGFSSFVQFHDHKPEDFLSKLTWSEWKAEARLGTHPNDPDISLLRQALVTATQINGPKEIKRSLEIIDALAEGHIHRAIDIANASALIFHYRIWGKTGPKLGMTSIYDSFQRLSRNPSILKDLSEILNFSANRSTIGLILPSLPFPCNLELHGLYGSQEIKGALGGATFESEGVTGVGFIRFNDRKAYAALITFQKSERDFSPSTMYQDYPISREILHWETPSTTSLQNETGQNLIHHQERGYTILFFARSVKRIQGNTTPFTFLGPASLISYESDRPIQMKWKLDHPMPVEIFEENRRGG